MSSSSSSFRSGQNIQDLEGKNGLLLDAPQRVDSLPAEEQQKHFKLFEKADPLQADFLLLFYSYVRYYSQLAAKVQPKVLHLLCFIVKQLFHSSAPNEEAQEEDAEEDEEDAAMVRRNTIKYYVYFLVFLIRDQEKLEAANAAAGVKKPAKTTAAAAAKGKRKAAAAVEEEHATAADEDDDEPASRSSASSTWPAEREKCLEALLSVLLVLQQQPASYSPTDLGRVFPAGVPEENFLALFPKVGEAVLERGLLVVRSGSRTRELAMLLIIAPAHLFPDLMAQESTASLLWNFIRQHAFGAQIVVELLTLASNKFKNERLAAGLIRQLGEDDDDEGEGSGEGGGGGGDDGDDAMAGGGGGGVSGGGLTGAHKNVAAFVELLAKAMPLLLKNNLSLLLPYLNQKDSYAMRCAIIRTLAFLVEHLHDPAAAAASASASSTASNTTELKILDTLADWAHDVSPYVRAAVAQAWNHLVDTKTLPLSHVLVALSIALDGARDKKVIVRKHSLALLEALLAQNCFGPELRLEPFAHEADTRKQELELILAKQEESDEDLDEQTDKRRLVLYESLHFLKTALLFITQVEKSVPFVCQHLLTSKTDDDVLGAVRFFATAKQFKLNGAEQGVRAMLKLVWRAHDNTAAGDKVRRALIETVERLYVAKVESPTKRVLYPNIAASLVDMAMHASQDELISLAEVVSEMRRPAEQACLKRTVLPPSAVEDLWPLILNTTSNNSNHSHARARVALCVLGMTATTSPEVVLSKPNSSKLVQAAFGSSTGKSSAKERRDLEFAKQAFQVLSIATKASASAGAGSLQLDAEERQLVERECVHVVCGKWHTELDFERKAWFGAAQAALDLVLDLSANTTTRAEKTYMFILDNLYETAMKREEDSNALCDLLFVSSHVALKLQVLAESLVQQIKRTKQKQVGRNKEEEEMLGASAEDDTEDVLLRQFAEDDLLNPTPSSVFTVCCEWAQKLCLASTKSGTSLLPALLKHCAVMALCKFMTVSERVCERNLSLLFTVLRDESEAGTRSVIVIALGDLAFRFPNAVEPFTSQMYRALRDPEVPVRKNALMVLTHLALNDMIKVRGEVSEIAMRIEDDDASVRDLARFFFAEIAKRGTNPIYHLLPDIFGSLSRESSGAVLGAGKFRSLAKFLVEFVDKDRQCESLAEKLCHRIHATCGSVTDVVVPSQLAPGEFQSCRDLAFCLEQLKCSDVLLRRLNDDSDLFKCVAPLLGDREVYTSISKLASRAAPKSHDAKRNLEELLGKLDKRHHDQASDIASYEKASTKSGAASTRATAAAAVPKLTTKKKTPAPRSAAKRKPVVQEEEDEDSEDSEEEEEEKPKPKKRAPPSKAPSSTAAASRSRRKKIIVEEEEEESE